MSPAAASRLSVVRGILLAVAAVSLLLVFHNFAIPLLPPRAITLDRTAIQPITPGLPAYAIPFDGGAPDASYDTRSRVQIFEDGTPLLPHADPALLLAHGNGGLNHQPGRLIFSATNNSDPRTNGRDYDVYYPVLFSRRLGLAAMGVFLACVFALYFFVPAAAPGAPRAGSGPPRFAWHVVGAMSLLLLGLYCSTGTLSPYANNGSAVPLPPANYLYNPDHVHFVTVFQFLDGAPREVWDHALFLRRILFPLLGYPFMKLWGFEIGGAIFSLVLNTTVFGLFLVLLRRHIGDRGTILAGWLLAFYPGVGYWGGLPYPYSIIFPASLLLTIGLLQLRESDSLPRIALVSLGMGVAYLGYDLIVYFLPVSVFVLLVRRKFLAAVVTAACQVLPLFGWLMIIRHGLHQPLENSNSATFGVLIEAYRSGTDFAHWWAVARQVPTIGLNIFFGSNFAFLPALFLVVVAVNALTSRIRVTSVELGLLGLGAALFVFNNLAPDYSAPWQMRGTWIARIYQPVFPAFVLFIARWFQALPPLPRLPRLGLAAAFCAAGAGCALTIFGPALNNPLGTSEDVFFAFVDSRAPHSFYQANLERYGRRPLGFSTPAP